VKVITELLYKRFNKYFYVWKVYVIESRGGKRYHKCNRSERLSKYDTCYKSSL